MRRTWRGKAAVAVISSVFALGGAAPALAQPIGPVSPAQKDTARRSYRAAELKFNEGDYAAALSYFEQAEATVPIPTTKYKIAVCQDRLGHVSEALRWYKAFLDASPPASMGEAIADARARLSALGGAAPGGAAAGQIRVSVTPAGAPGLTFVIDGGAPQLAAPLLSVPPGHHRLVVRADGFDPVAAELDVSVASPIEVRIALRPSGAAGPQQPGAPPLAPVGYAEPRSNVPAFVVLGVAGAAAVVGTAFGVLALKDKSAFNATPTTSLADQTQTAARVSDISFGVALACGVTSAVLLLVNSAHAREQAASRGFVAPFFLPRGGGGAALGLTF